MKMSIWAAVVAFVATLISVTIVTLMGKDTTPLFNFITALPQSLAAAAAIYAAIESGKANVTSANTSAIVADVQSKVNGRMTQLIAAKTVTEAPTTESETTKND